MKEFVEKLIERLEEKVAEYDIRIQRRNGACYYDESQNQKKLDERARGIEQAIEIVNQLAEEYVPETNVGKWIPCSERLPEDKYAEYYETVNISLTDGTVTSGCYINIDKEWWGDITDGSYEKITDKVIAWQPLPDPYKPTEGNSNKAL